jgi:peptidoglycan/LPS O-acetylase OafA/YrhL
MYVYHPLIILVLGKKIPDFTSSNLANYLIVYSLVITTTIIVSYISYNLYEKPFIRLKSKYQITKSSA